MLADVTGVGSCDEIVFVRATTMLMFYFEGEDPVTTDKEFLAWRQARVDAIEDCKLKLKVTHYYRCLDTATREEWNNVVHPAYQAVINHPGGWEYLTEIDR